jgi:SAM-dependent methyltransferase
MESPYTPEFFATLQAGSRNSAREIVPLILELIHPQSVVDVGCGDGTWLSVFQEFGIRDYLGIDGDYIESEQLQISSDNFLSFDLKQPISIEKAFDLVLSLEVAEHLPADCADIFVDSLTKLGEAIVFSAAIPYQGGTEHINEQWQNYWVTRFQSRGYQVIDCLRNKIWNNEQVEPWYAQNSLIFVKEDRLDNYPLLQQELQKTNTTQLAIVHPKIYTNTVPETRRLTPVQQPSSNPLTNTQLRLNENRFGSLELEITAVNLLDEKGNAIAQLDSGAFLRVAIEYLTQQSLPSPIFSVTISREDGLVLCDTNTTEAGISLSHLQQRGQITLCLDRLDLSSGQYFVDVGVYEQNWAYAYDYHWHVYPLEIRSTTNAKSILSPPLHWEISNVPVPDEETQH